MRKIIKSILVYATVAMVVCCSFLVTAFASPLSVVTPHKAESDKIYHNWSWVDSPGNYGARYMLRVGEYSISLIWILFPVFLNL